MSQKEMAYKIEKLQNKAEQIYSLQNALYAAIFLQNDFSVNNYDWAFILLEEMTMESMEELKVLTKCAFENFRKDGKGER